MWWWLSDPAVIAQVRAQVVAAKYDLLWLPRRFFFHSNFIIFYGGVSDPAVLLRVVR
jgi:hypothetical protein